MRCPAPSQHHRIIHAHCTWEAREHHNIIFVTVQVSSSGRAAWPRSPTLIATPGTEPLFQGLFDLDTGLSPDLHSSCAHPALFYPFLSSRDTQGGAQKLQGLLAGDEFPSRGFLIQFRHIHIPLRAPSPHGCDSLRGLREVVPSYVFEPSTTILETRRHQWARRPPSFLSV